MFKEEWQDGKKYRDDANGEKLRGIISDQGALKKSLFLRTKHMGSWLIIWGTVVKGTVLSTMEFHYYYVRVITLTPQP